MRHTVRSVDANPWMCLKTAYLGGAASHCDQVAAQSATQGGKRSPRSITEFANMIGGQPKQSPTRNTACTEHICITGLSCFNLPSWCARQDPSLSHSITTSDWRISPVRSQCSSSVATCPAFSFRWERRETPAKIDHHGLPKPRYWFSTGRKASSAPELPPFGRSKQVQSSALAYCNAPPSFVSTQRNHSRTRHL